MKSRQDGPQDGMIQLEALSWAMDGMGLEG